MTRVISLIFVLGLFYFAPNEVNCIATPPGASAVIGGITQGITGVIRGSRVSYCFTSAPCRSICPPGRGSPFLGTYCLFGRCFCQKGKVARRRNCRTPNAKLVKACTLPPGFNVIDKTTPLDPSVTILPDFDVCKARGRARGRSYCVFYTDLKNVNVVGGPDIPSIPELPENPLPVPIPGNNGRPPRRRRRKHKKSSTKNGASDKVATSSGANSISTGKIKAAKKEI